MLASLPVARLRAWKEHFIGEPHGALATGWPEPGSGVSAFAIPRERPALSSDQKDLLLKLARANLAGIASAGAAVTPELDLPPQLLEKRPCFVTLTKAGSLRGCMGNLLPRSELYNAVIENTRNAASRDPRFPPVEAAELDAIRIEITLLSEPRLLRFNSREELLDQLHPGEHGVLLQIGLRIATFLPQVWEQVPDKIEFLNRLAKKCGCAASAWRDKNANISVYHAEHFSED